MNIIIRKLNIFYIINKYKPRLIYFNDTNFMIMLILLYIKLLIIDTFI
jgi:hypothetical protein